jgi:glutamate formiminotransferase/formiminotetrahydrofolate cyclodeaminase
LITFKAKNIVRIMGQPELVECIPNFSEGRDPKRIDFIIHAIQSVQGVELLSVDMGASVNRTVLTFIGSPAAVTEGAFCGIRAALEVIDMRTHQGAHPRMGATDVCPFVPVEGVTMEDCIKISRQLGKRVGEELGIPVFLYGESAQKPERKNLTNIRRGEYEGMERKLLDPQWMPDFGPKIFNKKAGVTAIGAREYLIAFNINLNTKDKRYAIDIAFDLCEKGRSIRKGNIDPIYMEGDLVRYDKHYFPCGNCNFVGKNLQDIVNHCQKKHHYSLLDLLKTHQLDPENLLGKPVKAPGLFKHCNAIGWYVKEYERAQISTNLSNFKITPPHLVLEKARELAVKRGLAVTGSEIIGLVPFQAMKQAGIFYLTKQGKSTGLPIQEILQTAVNSMGLNDVSSFNMVQKIIGLPLSF